MVVSSFNDYVKYTLNTKQMTSKGKIVYLVLKFTFGAHLVSVWAEF